MNPILLDTHAAVWAASGRLAERVAKLINSAAEHAELLLSPITAWEITMLVRKQRLTLSTTPSEYVRQLFGQSGVVTAALTPAIAAAAGSLPGQFHSDAVDQILVATAAAYGARLMTRDKRIHDYAQRTKYLRCIGC